MIISTDIVDIHDSRLVDMNMLEPVQNKKWLLPSRHLCSTTSRLITFYHHQKIATSAIRKKKKRYQSSHHVSDAWPQQVTLVLKILNETVDKWGVALCFRLSVGQKLDAVIAHSIIIILKEESRPNEDDYQQQQHNRWRTYCSSCGWRWNLNSLPAVESPLWGPPV